MNTLPMNKVTRRSFVAGVAALLPASAHLGNAAARLTREPAVAPRANAGRGYRFFDAAEARFVEAACDRLIPADGSGPGALAAGVVHYLDRSLGGSWGAGGRPYREGPWQPGTAHGLPLPVTPAALFRQVVRAINEDFAARGMAFSELPGHVQDEFLAALESGAAGRGAASAAFFAMLLTMTVEGFFSNSPYGGFRDRVAWRLSGFPGAYAAVS